MRMIAWFAALASGTTVTAADCRDRWDSVDRVVEPFLEGRIEKLPFYFRYGGARSRDCLSGWKQTKNIQEVDARRTRVSIEFIDAATGLEVRAEAVVYRDFPATEWVLWFRNGSEKPTPLLTEVNALDMTLPTSDAAEPVILLNYNRGTNVDGEHLPGADDLQPMQANLRPGDRRRFVPYGGRPSDKVMPFFNLAAGGDRSGLFLGIGWTGEWAATFARNDAGATALSAGIRQMRASLQPGEEIRTASILLMAWRGNDSAEGHNQFRRLLLEHFTPRIAGKPVVPPNLGRSARHYFLRKNHGGQPA
jgi:alpha-galactosidase